MRVKVVRLPDPITLSGAMDILQMPAAIYHRVVIVAGTVLSDAPRWVDNPDYDPDVPFSEKVIQTNEPHVLEPGDAIWGHRVVSKEEAFEVAAREAEWDDMRALIGISDTIA